jgi:hypothetical protein
MGWGFWDGVCLAAIAGSGSSFATSGGYGISLVGSLIIGANSTMA